MFFRDLLKNNGSVAQFIDCEHTFVDKKLAKLYNLPEQKTLRLADGFEKVSLKGNKQRGGLLGMAGVLTVSANGVETTPVTRGVWVSENILGIAPPPPPDVVPAIDADVSGATTIRERLAKHRADNACAECHRKIDPLGFSLETFDPIGRWRITYPRPNGNKSVAPKNAKAPEPSKEKGKGNEKGKSGAKAPTPKKEQPPAPKIDSSGEFPSGETYTDFASFKKVISTTREDLFTRHLIRQFLTYTTGRHMELADDYVIDRLQEKVKLEGLGLKTLMVECLMSEVFRSR
jgi:hypothetical protein